MKSYIEIDELQARAMLAYFLYGRLKYGMRGYSEARLAGMSGYKSAMLLYLSCAQQHRRMRQEEVAERFEQLRESVRRLPRSEFRQMLLQTLAQMDPDLPLF